MYAAQQCCRFLLSNKLILVLLLALVINIAQIDGLQGQRVKRKISLLFPGPSSYTLIIGFGIPVEDLDYETVVSGFAFRITYRLPTRAEHTRPHYSVINIERKLSNKMGTNNTNDAPSSQYFRKLHHSLKSRSKYRWMFYKALAMLSEHFGYAGRSCVLKSICEVAAVPFHYKNGIVGEILHLLMTPTSSKDVLLSHADNEYFHAEALGISGAPCQHIFQECSISALEYLTKIIEFPKYTSIYD